MLPLAILIGIGFYLLDNNQNNVSSTPVATPVEATPTDEGEGVAVIPTTLASDINTPANTPESLPMTSVDITPTAIVMSASVIPDATRLVVPAAGINQTIVQVFLDGVSWDVSRLGMNVGHLQGTAWVGSGNNIVLSGHVELADGRSGIFHEIGDLQIGDLVIIASGDEEYRYRISSISTTQPDDLTPLYPTTQERLTLITCGSYNFFANAYEDRIIVVAERIT